MAVTYTTTQIADLLESVPVLAQIADVEVTEFPLIPSFAISINDIRELASAIAAAARAGVMGAVVSHGSDTIEETAYGLGTMLDVEMPVVLTAAMRPNIYWPVGPVAPVAPPVAPVVPATAA